MRNWPKWLRITFIVFGCAFVLAVVFTGYVLISHAVIPPLSVSTPSTPENPHHPKSEPTPVVVYITAITGLVTATSGLYGQILAGRKMKLDYELAKQRLEMESRKGDERAGAAGDALKK